MKPIYLPGLNGLRAIAAIAVVLSHITLAFHSFNLDPYILGALKDGSPMGISLASFGVSMFFALSGFLITYLLQQEKEVQSIDIKKFYLRRILRIWPLYYLYLIVGLIVIHQSGASIDGNALLFYIFFAANIPYIKGTNILMITHYWSLGVEEQFYLFWPWLNKKTSNLIPFMVTFITLFIVSKLVLHFYFEGSLLETAIEVTRFHCMIIGALGAILYRRKNKLFLKLTDNKTIQIASFIVIMLAAINKFHIASIIDNEIISLITVILIIGQINVKNRVINLDGEGFDFLGKISYGIYMIHPVIIFLFSKVIRIEHPTAYSYILVYLLCLSATLVIAWISYTYFESYFLKMKTKISVIKSSGTKHITGVN